MSILKQDIVSTDLSESWDEVPIGVGFYPTISMLNHSCDPDVLPIYNGSKVILKSIKNIPTGNEVTFSYGPTYLNMNYSKRQQVLKDQYFFTCNCCACLNKFENYNNALLCKTCNGPGFVEGGFWSVSGK